MRLSAGLAARQRQGEAASQHQGHAARIVQKKGENTPMDPVKLETYCQRSGQLQQQVANAFLVSKRRRMAWMLTVTSSALIASRGGSRGDSQGARGARAAGNGGIQTALARIDAGKYGSANAVAGDQSACLRLAHGATVRALSGTPGKRQKGIIMELTKALQELTGIFWRPPTGVQCVSQYPTARSAPAGAGHHLSAPAGAPGTSAYGRLRGDPPESGGRPWAYCTGGAARP